MNIGLSISKPGKLLKVFATDRVQTLPHRLCFLPGASRNLFVNREGQAGFQEADESEMPASLTPAEKTVAGASGEPPNGGDTETCRRERSVGKDGGSPS